MDLHLKNTCSDNVLMGFLSMLNPSQASRAGLFCTVRVDHFLFGTDCREFRVQFGSMYFRLR